MGARERQRRALLGSGDEDVAGERGRRRRWGVRAQEMDSFSNSFFSRNEGKQGSGGAATKTSLGSGSGERCLGAAMKTSLGSGGAGDGFVFEFIFFEERRGAWELGSWGAWELGSWGAATKTSLESGGRIRFRIHFFRGTNGWMVED